MSLLIMVLIFSPILFGLLCYIFKVSNPMIIIAVQIAFFIMAIINFIRIREKGFITFVIGQWESGKGIRLKLDHLSGALIMLTTFLFILFFLYEWKTIQSKSVNVFMFLLLTLEGLLIALFLSHDLFNIFALMEVSTILVSILIVFKKYPISYYDGLIYLLINILGMTFFLLGIGYIYRLYGVLDLELLKGTIQGADAPSNTLALTYGLLFTGITLKIGAVPVFTWLPRAHGSRSAPSVVSAILSGLYINLGFVFYIKFQEIFSPIYDTRVLFLGIGIVTAFLGGLLALAQDDIKKLLGYSTVSQIGFILLGLNLTKEPAFFGSIYHILSHSIFKALLFLIAGILVHQHKTRKLSEIEGVLSSTPVLGICTILGILGITGAPFFNGSIGKYLISSSSMSIGLEVTLYALNFLTILYLAKFSMILFGKKERVSTGIHKSVVTILLGVLCLVGGIGAPVFMMLFFEYNLKINIGSYLFKALIYVLSVAGGFWFYKTKVKHTSFMKILREIDLPFNFIVTMVFLLFAVITGYVYLL